MQQGKKAQHCYAMQERRLLLRTIPTQSPSAGSVHVCHHRCYENMDVYRTQTIDYASPVNDSTRSFPSWASRLSTMYSAMFCVSYLPSLLVPAYTPVSQELTHALCSSSTTPIARPAAHSAGDDCGGSCLPSVSFWQTLLGTTVASCMVIYECVVDAVNQWRRGSNHVTKTSSSCRSSASCHHRSSDHAGIWTSRARSSLEKRLW